jgi:hypothetical protein
MTDDQFRRQIARPDADIVLDPQAMAQQGARFEVKRDFQLNNQQLQMMADSRASLQRVGSITRLFRGRRAMRPAACRSRPRWSSRRSALPT